MITAKNICKSYGNLPILYNIDLQVRQGEFITIIGESGSGKTTLLQILGTLDKWSIAKDGGESSLILNGKDISKMTDKEISRFRNQEIGFVFQSHQLIPELTAIENVMLPGLIAKKPSQKLREQAAEILKKLNLQERYKHKPSQLSGGEQQRVAVARSLINKPMMIFADEPSGNLDAKSSQELHQWLLKIRDDFSTTFVIVTHNYKLASMADRVLEIKNGKLISSKDSILKK